MNKLTYADLAGAVARTREALPDADWNEPKLPLADQSTAAKFRAAKYEAPPDRRAKAISGPVQWTTTPVLIYRPRWKTDHHPWVLKSTYWIDKGMNGGLIRFANYEVEEVTA